MKKVVLIATPIILLTFMFVVAALAYDANANCQRTVALVQIPPGTWWGVWVLQPVNTAKAKANNNGLTNGMIAVEAYAGGTLAALSTSYSAAAINWTVSDQGPWSSSGHADAFVNGRDPHGIPRSDWDSN